MAAKPAGSICAAQPVTTMRASGFSRRALRIAWRAWRVASAVTAQVLISTARSRPAAAAWPRMTSLSKALRRQPKETISIIGSRCARADRKLAREADGDRAGHAQMVVGQPFDLEAAAIENDFRAPSRELAPCRRHQGRAGTGAAGARDADTALPDPHADPLGRDHGRDLDIDPVGKERMALDHRTEGG